VNSGEGKWQTTPVQLNLPRKSSVGSPGVKADSTDYYYYYYCYYYYYYYCYYYYYYY